MWDLPGRQTLTCHPLEGPVRNRSAGARDVGTTVAASPEGDACHRWAQVYGGGVPFSDVGADHPRLEDPRVVRRHRAGALRQCRSRP